MRSIVWLQEPLDLLEVTTDERLGQLKLRLDGDELLATVALAGVIEDGRKQAREERAGASDADAVVVVRGNSPVTATSRPVRVSVATYCSGMVQA